MAGICPREIPFAPLTCTPHFHDEMRLPHACVHESLASFQTLCYRNLTNSLYNDTEEVAARHRC